VRDRDDHDRWLYDLGTGKAEHCRDVMHQPGLSLSGDRQMFVVAILLHMYCLASETRQTGLENSWADGLLLTVAVCYGLVCLFIKYSTEHCLELVPGQYRTWTRGDQQEEYQGIIFQSLAVLDAVLAYASKA